MQPNIMPAKMLMGLSFPHVWKQIENTNITFHFRKGNVIAAIKIIDEINIAALHPNNNTLLTTYTQTKSWAPDNNKVSDNSTDQRTRTNLDQLY